MATQSRVVGERPRHPDPGERLEQRGPRRAQAGVAALPERRVGGQGQQQRQVGPHPVEQADAGLGVGDADVHVQREGGLAPRQLAHGVVDRVVAVSAGQDGLVPHGERVGARAGAAQLRGAPARRRACGAGAAAPRRRRRRCGAPRCPAPARSGGSRASRARRSSSDRMGSTRSICCASDQSPGFRSMTSSSTPRVYSLPGFHSAQPGSSLMPPCGPSAGRRADRTRPSNRAACSGRWVSVSACHCTPTKKSRSGSSTPSIRPSAAHATGRSPWPSRSIAWWWKELTWTSSAPISAVEAAAGLDGRPRG